MKCCLVTPYPPERCGIAIYSSKLASNLALFLEVTVIGNRSRRTESKSDGRIKIVCSWRRNSPMYIHDIVRDVAHEAPHIIHVQHEYLAYGARKYSALFPALLLILRLFGRPIVLTMHSVVRRDRLSDDFFFIHQTGRRFSAIKRSIMTIFTRLIVRISKAVIVHSEEMKNVLTRDYNLEDGKVFVIPHGADVHEVQGQGTESRRPVGLSLKRILLFFGFIIPGKGLEVLLRSFLRVSTKIPHMVLVIAGGYHPRLRQEFPRYIGTIERLIDRLGLSGKVIFENRFVSSDHLERYVSVADVVTFPYVDDSVVGVSGALATCAGWGKAVIAARIPRFSSEIDNGHDGVLVEPNDEHGLMSAIMWLAEDENLRRRIGENLREKARRRNWTKTASLTYELYVKLIQEATSSLVSSSTQRDCAKQRTADIL